VEESVSNGNQFDTSYKWIVLLITTVGSFMTPLDGSIVSIALPSIASNLGINFTTIIWIPTTYLLFLSVLLLIFGRLADTEGRRTLFISGFALFTMASGLCAVSRTGVELIIFRAVQGLSAAMIGATSPAIVTDVFPKRDRGKVLGINATAVYVGLSVGPTLGGFLVQNLGWRWIFLINIPIGIFVVALSLLKLKESINPEKREKFDLLGGGTFSIGLSTLLLALTLGPEYGWSCFHITGLFAISGIAFILFVLIEKKMGGNALFEISLFTHNRLFASANTSALLNYASFFGVTFLMSFYLQRILNLSPAQAGLILLSMPIVMAAFSPVSGWLSDKFGTRLLSSVGMVLISLGLFMFSTISVDSTGFDIVARLLLIGLGMGVFSSPNTSAVMGSVEKDRLSVAAGTLATMRFVGQSVSLAVMGAVASTAVSQQIISNLILDLPGLDVTLMASAFVEGIRRAFLVSGFIAAIGVITSLFRGKGN
jgi:EmrB/QacA subfamily drug resistance transporter